MNEVLKCLCERRSCRSYRPEQVKEDTLRRILEAGTYAASGMGKQSARIVVVPVSYTHLTLPTKA